MELSFQHIAHILPSAVQMLNKAYLASSFPPHLLLLFLLEFVYHFFLPPQDDFNAVTLI